MIRSVVIVVGLAVWGGPGTWAAGGKLDPQASEAAAWKTAKPAFDKYCAGCHTQGAKAATKKKLSHFDMTSYPPGGHHAQTIGVTIRDVLGLSGKKPRMPQDRPGIVTGDDLAAIKAWTEAWDAAEKAGAHRGRSPRGAVAGFTSR
jgi:mono/diheme cytochrome c family protein